MPRQARLDAPGVLQHIMIRGMERREIFLDHRDQEDLQERLAHLLPQTGTPCYAWALMPNHAHFLLRRGVTPMATVMRRLLTGYAVRFNRRHERSGRLFQNRYKSIVCQENAYFKELVRYIHLNPVRAGVVTTVQELADHPHCGHGALMGRIQRPWQDVDFVLGCFAEDGDRARSAYAAFVEGGLDQGRRPDLSGGGLVRSAGGWTGVKSQRRNPGGSVKGDERILGDASFVDELLSRGEDDYERRYRLRRLGLDLDGIAGRVAELLDVDPQEVLSKGKQPRRVRARSLFCYWAVRELGMTIREVARRLDMSPPAVGYGVARGEGVAREGGYRLMEES